MTRAIAQRENHSRIELHAYGFGRPLVFDRADVEDDEITIQRLRLSDDAETILLLTAAVRREASIKLIPLDDDASIAGTAIVYSGKAKVCTRIDSNSDDLSLLTIVIKNARVSVIDHD